MKKITFKKFSSNFCGPCKMIIPIWDEIKSEYSKLFNFVEIDCDTDDEQVEKFHIQGIPAIVIVDENDNEISRVKMPVTQEGILDEIRKHML